MVLLLQDVSFYGNIVVLVEQMHLSFLLTSSWGEWSGEGDKYARMKYKGGQNCWNGPDRSTEVRGSAIMVATFLRAFAGKKVNHVFSSNFDW